MAAAAHVRQRTMSYDFWIQASNPRWHTSTDPGATTLDEAVESVFPSDTEDAFVVWRHVYVPLGYKYDVGTILRDVIEMVRVLLGSESGDWRVTWPSNTFAATWRFEWAGDRLVVVASEWIQVVGDTEGLLRERPTIRLGRLEFVQEWRSILERTHEALVGGGCLPTAIPDLALLSETVRQMRGHGALYR